MNRRTHARAGLTLAIVAVASVAPMAVMTAVASAEAAIEEYVLQVPGVSSDSASGGTVVTKPVNNGEQAQIGVVGESSPPDSPLGALRSAVSETPPAVALLVALFALAGLGLVVKATARSRSGTA